MASSDQKRSTGPPAPSHRRRASARQLALLVVLLLVAGALLPAHALADKGEGGGKGRGKPDKADKADKPGDAGDDDHASTSGASSPLATLLERVQDELSRPPVELPEEAKPPSDEEAAPPPEETSAALPAIPKPDWAGPDVLLAGGGVVAYAVSGVGGLLLLGLALVVARRAARPPVEHPRDPLEAARTKALRAAPSDADGVVRALRRARYGKLLHARVGPADAELSLRRKRGASCGEVASFFSGLLETAWGRDVDVEHVECAGKKRGPCAFRARARAAPGR